MKDRGGSVNVKRDNLDSGRSNFRVTEFDSEEGTNWVRGDGSCVKSLRIRKSVPPTTSVDEVCMRSYEGGLRKV